MKTSFFWDIMLYSPAKVSHCFGGTCRHSSCLLHADFLLGIVFIPRDGGDMFQRNVSRLSQSCTVFHPRRYNSL